MSTFQEQMDSKSAWLLRGKYAAYVVCWVAFVAAIFYLLTRLRLNLLFLLEVFDVNRWARSAIHNFVFVVLGLVGLSLIIIVEHYLRTAVVQDLLVRRAVISVGSVLVLLVASFALHGILLSILMV